MRSVFAVALFLMGACATTDEAEPDVYGIYDVVFIGGDSLPRADGQTAWVELRADSTFVFAIKFPKYPDPTLLNAEFTLGAMKDGCVPFTTKGAGDPEWIGSICGDVLTFIEAWRPNTVAHKRR